MHFLLQALSSIVSTVSFRPVELGDSHLDFIPSSSSFNPTLILLLLCLRNIKGGPQIPAWISFLFSFLHGTFLLPLLGPRSTKGPLQGTFSTVNTQTEAKYSTASNSAILAHKNRATLTRLWQVQEHRVPPVEQQEIQAYIQHLWNWEIDTWAAIGSLFMHLSSFVNFPVGCPNSWSPDSSHSILPWRQLSISRLSP